MGWAIGAGLALTLLLLVALANLMLIVARFVRDRMDARFLLLTIASLGSGQAFLFYIVARTGFLSVPTFEIIWLVSTCIAILCFVVVLVCGRANREEDRF